MPVIHGYTIVDLRTLWRWPTRCVDLVASWMGSNRLRWTPTRHRSSGFQRQCDKINFQFGQCWLIDGLLVHPVRAALYLGVFIDADLIMRSYVTPVVVQCFVAKRQLRLISQLLSPSTLKMYYLDWPIREQCADRGRPAYLVKRLQSLLNTSARPIYGLRRYDPVSNVPVKLTIQWLGIPKRI